MLKLPIYLDYSATTPVDPRVAEKMIPYLVEKFGNPASRSHPFGWEAKKAVEEAREQVAALVNADPKEIVWTSGATESNNLAIKGAALAAQKRGKHIVTVQTESKAVLDTVKWLFLHPDRRLTTLETGSVFAGTEPSVKKHPPPCCPVSPWFRARDILRYFGVLPKNFVDRR